MGRITPEHLYHILWAANRFSRNPDPATDINAYLIANNQWTANVREDSGQPDAWRDYQQSLSELGLIYSLSTLREITPTPLGLALLDGSMGFSEIMTLQALRMQYPNGHHVKMGAQNEDLARTAFAAANTLPELQVVAGVCVRPAVLAWRVLRRLENLGSPYVLSVTEVETYLMRCSTNAEAMSCADAINTARAGGFQLPRIGKRQRRNAQDWVRFLALTSIFSITADGNELSLTLSAFGRLHASEVDEVCLALEVPATFWEPGDLSPADRLRWYSDYGGLDLAIPELPEIEAKEKSHEFVDGEERDEDRGRFEDGVTGGQIQLRAFQGIQLPAQPPAGLTIQSVYSAELANSAHRLHDQMVLLVAETCRLKGASVFEDRSSVDLLVEHQHREFIIEVKSVTPRNFIARLRYALGQVLHYDYLRAPASQVPRRRVVAFAAQIPPTSWSIDFVNRHVDTDLLTLDSGRLRVYSPSRESLQLFG
jgi:hypothetical protein